MGASGHLSVSPINRFTVRSPDWQNVERHLSLSFGPQTVPLCLCVCPQQWRVSGCSVRTVTTLALSHWAHWTEAWEPDQWGTFSNQMNPGPESSFSVCFVFQQRPTVKVCQEPLCISYYHLYDGFKNNSFHTATLQYGSHNSSLSFRFILQLLSSSKGSHVWIISCALIISLLSFLFGQAFLSRYHRWASILSIVQWLKK